MTPTSRMQPGLLKNQILELLVIAAATPAISFTCQKIYALDISGEIPSELFVLKELMDLNLGQNVLNGSIPAEIEQLSNMQYL
uniref:Leucine-rich repeat-containing N-terminal plant-type domain-containing protein n=1 Tax=Salix viminalis TaxID=40686 RepID=A0A6N2L049_SALVM